MPRLPSASAHAVTIHNLLAYHLHRVANQISRSAAMHYRREFGVSLAEWRTIALLGADGPMALTNVAREAGLLKSQMSRVVSGLVQRGLILRRTDRADGRAAHLTLSAAGRRTYTGLTKASERRNARLLACLSANERDTIFASLGKLATEARRLVSEERCAG